MERATLQVIAQSKYDDAELLFKNGRFSNAYYLFGYAAEIAIKARIAQKFQPDTIPDKRFVNDIYSHDLTKLIALAGLTAELAEARRLSAEFDDNWATVVRWEETSRYDMIGEPRAAAMRSAMADEEHGVFRWLQNIW
jgi:hypothetical protein